MELQKEIALENEKKRKETEGRPRKENCTPIGVQNTDDNRSRSNTWTDSQTAKKAGVGVGTVARYNRVMNLILYSDSYNKSHQRFVSLMAL